MFAAYRNPDLSNNIFDCLFMAEAKVHPVDRKAFFLFVADVNAHHEEWLMSSTANLQGRSARDFASSSGCEPIVSEPTHTNGGVLDLVLPEFFDVVGVRVGSPVGTSDHSAVFYRCCATATFSSLGV